MRLKGFKNSPTCFAEALYQDLLSWVPPKTPQGQYPPKCRWSFNCSKGEEECLDSTTHVLWTLHQLGHKVSATKAQLCTRGRIPEVLDKKWAAPAVNSLNWNQDQHTPTYNQKASKGIPGYSGILPPLDSAICRSSQPSLWIHQRRGRSLDE